MNTHELARSLNILARALRNGPKVKLDELNELIGSKTKKEMSPDEIKIGLSHLVALSRIDKQKWIDLIGEYDFRINLNPRASSRDVLGKLLTYLEKNPEARQRLSHTTPMEKASPELLKALDSLLRE